MRDGFEAQVAQDLFKNFLRKVEEENRLLRSTLEVVIRYALGGRWEGCDDGVVASVFRWAGGIVRGRAR